MRRTQIFNATDLNPTRLMQLARLLKEGALAAIPTDTVYGIATGAFCEQSITEIYQLKKRPSGQPLQLLMGNTDRVRQVAQFSVQAEALAQAYWPGALTLILPPTQAGTALLRGFEGLGIRVPATAFLQSLLSFLDVPLACTSANEHGKPVITNEQDLVELVEGKVDFIIKAGALSPIPSSVVDLTNKPRLLREGALSKESLERVMGGLLIV